MPQQRRRKTLEEKLWPRIQKGEPDDCWPWLGGTAGKGYGSIHKFIGDKQVSAYAHREILELHKGPPPPDKPHALHSCDNPSCCNPAHLSWGSNSKNRREARDRLNNQGNQKLTLEQVEAIRLDTRVYQTIADDYGVHRDTIARIKQKRAWNP